MAERPKRTKKKKKNRGVFLSWLAFVALPTLVAGLYYAFIAADQYAVETRFAVRSSSPSLRSGILGSLGIGLGGVENDTYIILEYIHSREMLSRIDKQLNLRKSYQKPRLDIYARLPEDATFEDFLEYWKSMTGVNLDRTSRIITLKVYAFSPEDAHDIAKAVLEESERMVNDLSERARADALAYAREEVAKAEARLREIRRRFTQFRSSTQQIDPAKQAEVQVVLTGKLEERLSLLQAKLAEARSYLSENAPTIVYMKNRIAALKKQIREEKNKLGDKKQPHGAAGKSNSMSAILSDYEALLVEREFAQKLYVSALSGLEEARVLANRQQRYLATFDKPYVPDEALYPKRVRNTIFIFLSLFLIWALGSLMAQSIKDRM